MSVKTFSCISPKGGEKEDDENERGQIGLVLGGKTLKLVRREGVGEGGGEVLVAAMPCGDGVGANQAHQNHAGKTGSAKIHTGISRDKLNLTSAQKGDITDSFFCATLRGEVQTFQNHCAAGRNLYEAGLLEIGVVTHQVRGTGERVRLAAAGLAVAEARGREAVDGHVDEAPDPGVLQDVLLARLGLEHHVERERLQLVRLFLRELDKKSNLLRIIINLVQFSGPILTHIPPSPGNWTMLRSSFLISRLLSGRTRTTTLMLSPSISSSDRMDPLAVPFPPKPALPGLPKRGESKCENGSRKSRLNRSIAQGNVLVELSVGAQRDRGRGGRPPLLLDVLGEPPETTTKLQRRSHAFSSRRNPQLILFVPSRVPGSSTTPSQVIEATSQLEEL